MSYIRDKAKAARDASYLLAGTSAEIKDNALGAMTNALEKNSARILEANRKDLRNAAAANLPKAFISRLKLSEEKIRGMADSIRSVQSLQDPIGEVMERFQRPNGLAIEKIRVPLGVVAVIYESRPDVTVEATALCIKSGNAIILRGGSEAINSNRVLADVLTRTAESFGIAKGAIQFVEKTDRKIVTELIGLRQFVDVVIPRGGQGLIDTLVKHSSIPVLESGRGNCHIYVDESADFKMAERIVVNAKVQYCSACNAAEKLLVHKSVARGFLPLIAKTLRANGVKLVGCVRTRGIVGDVKKATEHDWYEEYLDLKMAVKVVDNVDEAIGHINKYGTGHSDAIVTENYENAEKFLHNVDSAAVYHNASTRFTDGGQFGFGGEIGISTQKIHARGPLGLRELTSAKYIVRGNGQIRGEKAQRVAVIGAGNMGSIIAERLIRNGIFEAKDVLVTGHDKGRLAYLESLGASIEDENSEAARKSDVMVLCVKPKDMQGVLGEIGEFCRDKLVISIAAAFPLSSVKKGIPTKRVIRAMPNICASVNSSLTALCASKEATRGDRFTAERIFSSIGDCFYLEEGKFAAFTGIGGSGPAFVFMMMDCLAKIAEENGFSRADAVKIAAKTMSGSAKVVLESGQDIGKLMNAVASRGGITEAGLRTAEELGIAKNFKQVLSRAVGRAKELEK